MERNRPHEAATALWLSPRRPDVPSPCTCTLCTRGSGVTLGRDRLRHRPTPRRGVPHRILPRSRMEVLQLRRFSKRSRRARREPPITFRGVVARLAEELGSRFVSGFEDMSPMDRLSILSIKRSELIKDWHTLWRKHDLDAVVCPPAPNTAVEYDMYGLTPYTRFLNLLDVSLLPVGTELWLISLINGCNSIQLVSSHFIEQGDTPNVKRQYGQFVPDCELEPNPIYRLWMLTSRR
jgi:hypothetical protein